MTFARTPASYRSAPPELDEHGSAIRQWLRDADKTPLPTTTAVTQPVPTRSEQNT